MVAWEKSKFESILLLESSCSTIIDFSSLCKYQLNQALREKCPNTELFLVRIWTFFTQ